MNRQSESPIIHIDVTTLMSWQRPVVGIVRVEQQLGLWLLNQSVENIRFVTFDKKRRNFLNVTPDALRKQLSRIAGHDSPTGGHTGPIRLSAEQQLRNRALGIVARLPGRLRYPAHKSFLAARPAILRAVTAARALRQRFRSHKEAPSPVPYTGQVYDMPPGATYVSLGLDWDYKDMAYLYSLKREKRLRMLLFCYDIIPIKYPHLCVADVSRQFAHYFADLAWCADRILCISQASRHDLLEFLAEINVPQPDSRVVTLGSNIHPPESNAAPPAIANLDKERFVLFVSTIERRKNHEVIYRAFARLAEKGVSVPKLVFVGMPGWGVADLMSDIRLDPRVTGIIHILNHVSDAELAWLYQNAQFTVFPSLYEGWGLPVAESLSYGKFCLCSDTSSLPEVGGDLTEYIDPWDLPRWEARLRYYIEHPEALAERNMRIAAEYRAVTWQSTSADIYRHARELANEQDG